MRLLVLVTMCLLACKQKDQIVSNDIVKPALTNEIGNCEDQSWIKVDSAYTLTKNVKYSIENTTYRGKNESFIIRNSNVVKRHRAAMGQESEIVVDLFKIDTHEFVTSVSKKADDISFSVDGYMEAVNYGCCGAESYYEFFTVDKSDPFLKFHSKYFHIEIPNSRIDFYLGFLVAPNKEDRSEGHLTLAHRVPVFEGAQIVGFKFEKVNTVEFKFDNNSTFDEYPHFTPEIRLLTHSSQDKIIDNELYQLLTLWSFNNERSVRNISFDALKIEFGDKDGMKFILPIKNGFLMDDKGEKQTLTIIDE